MTAALLEGELPLFDVGAAGHLVTVTDELISYVAGRATKVAVWFTIACSCGYTSAGRARWNHRDLAVRMGQHHFSQDTDLSSAPLSRDNGSGDR